MSGRARPIESSPWSIDMGDTRQLIRELLLAFAGFSLLVASVTLLWRNNLLLLIVVLLECLIALRRWHDRMDVSFLLIIAIFGSLAELVFVRFGIWRYTNPSLAGMPLWFPVAFGTTGLIGQRLARIVAALWERTASSSTSG
jgi:hypothetical protein